jgi:hypothetical protein
VNDTKLSIKPYEEEESYENPVNLSKMPGLAEDYMDIKSDYAPHPATSIGISKGFVNIENLELDVSLEHDPNDLKDIKIGLSSQETVRMPNAKKESDSQKQTDKAKKVNDLDIFKPSKAELKPLQLEESKG